MTLRAYDVEIGRLVVTGIGTLPADAEGLRARLARALERELAPTLAARPGSLELESRDALRIDLPPMSFDDEGAVQHAVAAIAGGVAVALSTRPMAEPPAPPPASRGEDRG